MKCAWCGKPKDGMAGSHGICSPCVEIMMKEVDALPGQKAEKVETKR